MRAAKYLWTAYSAAKYTAAGLCAIVLCGSIISCKDPITTNDPRQIIVDTKVAVVVTNTPLNTTNLVQWDTSIITVTVCDTDQNNGIKVLSAKITGSNQTFFQVVDTSKFPTSLNPKDSMKFRIRFIAGDTGIMHDTLRVLVDTAIGVNVAVPLNIGSVKSVYTPYHGALSLSDTALDFGFVRVDSTKGQSVLITSTGTSPVRITNIYFVGSDSVNFGCTIMPSLRTPFVMNPGNSISLQLQFNPYSLHEHSSTLVITADSLPSYLIYLTGIGANDGMSVVPSQLKFSYFDSATAANVAYDTLYDYNLDTSVHYVDSIKVQAANTTLFTILGTFPVAANPPSGPNRADGLLTPIAIIRFNGTNTATAQYGYLQVYFRGATNGPILVPLIAGPF